jgi:hypothetical protein
VWLAQGREIDHATFANFRKEFGPHVRALFGQTVRVAMRMGLVRLNQVAFDGTMIKANNGRYNTARIKDVEAALLELDRQVGQMLEQAGEEDRREDLLYGQEASPTKLPRKWADLRKRQEALGKALQELRAMDLKRAGRKDVSPKGPQVPLADSDARVLPNKEGGYAPNHVPILGVDGQAGIVVHASLAEGNDEAGSLLEMVDQVGEDLGQAPKQVLADGGFHTGANLTGLEQRGIEALIPERQRPLENPAADPARQQVAEARGPGEQSGPPAPPPEPQPPAPASAPEAVSLGPVPPEQWDKLPINPQHKVLDKAAFIYDPVADRYVCPMGQALEFKGTDAYQRDSGSGVYRVYECSPGVCGACPLAKVCIKGKTKARRVMRDEHQGARDRAAQRLESPQGRADYRRRWWIAETPFGILKTVMDCRRFLLRGREGVETELNWIATAFNLRKLIRIRAAGPATAGGACAI